MSRHDLVHKNCIRWTNPGCAEITTGQAHKSKFRNLILHIEYKYKFKKVTIFKKIQIQFSKDTNLKRYKS